MIVSKAPTVLSVKSSQEVTANLHTDFFFVLVVGCAEKQEGACACIAMGLYGCN